MLKDTLRSSGNENKFLEILYSLSLSDPGLLEKESIKSIIEFKWQTYARSFYVPQFLLLICFCILFIIDSSVINSIVNSSSKGGAGNTKPTNGTSYDPESIGVNDSTAL